MSGKNTGRSEITDALLAAMNDTTADIHVHVSERRWERNIYRRALAWFHFYRLQDTRQKNAVLIYLNTRSHRFAIVADDGLTHFLNKSYWDELGGCFREDLQSTQFERAVALTLRTLGVTLQKYFPRNL